ncbi:MAG: TetR/AcrR family transcriptional regulator [Pyrinomonadaceae bacterium]
MGNSKENIKGDPSEQTRWRRRKDARPGEILEAALDCFVEFGYAGTRLDQIAGRAGVSKGTLYLYFSGKEEILKSVIREEIIGNLAQAEKLLANDRDTAAESLRRLFRFFAKIFATSNVSAIPKLIISESGNFPELVRFYHKEVITRGFGIIEGILRRGIKNGEFRPIKVEFAVYCVIAPALLAMLWKHSFEPYVPRKMSVESLFETQMDLILSGMLKQ